MLRFDELRLPAMKRSFRKISVLVLWAIGSFGAVLFTCWWAFVMVYARKFSPFAFANVALGIFAAWKGLQYFNEERKSN
jgi:CHASE2 domain-containing sensor protein